MPSAQTCSRPRDVASACASQSALDPFARIVHIIRTDNDGILAPSEEYSTLGINEDFNTRLRTIMVTASQRRRLQRSAPSVHRWHQDGCMSGFSLVLTNEHHHILYGPPCGKLLACALWLLWGAILALDWRAGVRISSARCLCPPDQFTPPSDTGLRDQDECRRLCSRK